MNVQTGPGMPMIHLAEKRCLNLRCPRGFNLSFPPSYNNSNIIVCDCGILFCSKDCKEEHKFYGHKQACPHIKEAAARKKNNSSSSLSSETNEEFIEVQRLVQQNATWPCAVLIIAFVSDNASNAWWRREALSLEPL